MSGNRNSDIQIAADRIIEALREDKDLNKISASGGSKYIATGTTGNLSATSFYVREDTTVSAISGSDTFGTSVNILTLLNLGGVTMGQGDFYVVPNGYKITSMSIAGSVIVYLK